jgi:hypothetical protein
MEQNPRKAPFTPPPKRLSVSARFWLSVAALVALCVLSLAIALFPICLHGLHD